MAKQDYKVNVEFSSKELTPYEKIAIKDTSNTKKLDEAIQENGSIIVDFDYYVLLTIHNEKSENKDYEVTVVVDKDGTKYSTSSQSFMSSLDDIYEELNDEGITDFKIKIYSKESKNYKGKYFITCSLV